MRVAWVLIGLAMLTASGAAELRFEAERWSTPAEAWVAEDASPTKWTLWSTDVDAAKKWSQGVVLRTPIVEEDRATPDEGAPALHTHLTGIPAGTYDVVMNGTVRVLGISPDGQAWHPSRGGVIARGVRLEGTYDLWVDDKYAEPDHHGSAYYDFLLLRPVAARVGWLWDELVRSLVGA